MKPRREVRTRESCWSPETEGPWGRLCRFRACNLCKYVNFVLDGSDVRIWNEKRTVAMCCDVTMTLKFGGERDPQHETPSHRDSMRRPAGQGKIANSAEGIRPSDINDPCGGQDGYGSPFAICCCAILWGKACWREIGRKRSWVGIVTVSHQIRVENGRRGSRRGEITERD
jgi:hypothetical protein